MKKIQFDVFLYGGFVQRSRQVAVDCEEWDWIVDPLLDLHNDAKVCHSQDTFEAGMRATLEREALSDAVSRFEMIVGPKTGTAGDVGGLAGNDVITNAQQVMMDHKGRLRVKEAEGQQDCVNEAWTTKGFIEALMQRGLLMYHDMPAETAIFELPSRILKSVHVAVLLLDKSYGEPQEWIVDSWPRDNGMPPDIWPRAKWIKYWSKAIFGPSKN